MPKENPLRLIDYGLFVVSSRQEGRVNGLAANVVFQIAAQPLLIATCIHKEHLTHAYIEASGAFNVSLLAESAPLALIELFGLQSGREVDKFSRVPHQLGKNGIPYLTGDCLAYLECKVEHAFDAGRQTIFTAAVTGYGHLAEGRPLTAGYYRGVQGGVVPPGASLYLSDTLHFG